MAAGTPSISTKHGSTLQIWTAEYGGPKVVLDVLEFDKDAVGRHVVAGYFVAKSAIDAAETVEVVNVVDLPGGPGMVAQA